jgi:methylmalonyl-CoA mutase N-terminal domain/subunit
MYRGRSGPCGSTRASASAVETNRRYRYLLEQGQTGLSVAFDLPTQMGYDPDARWPRRVGKVGVSIATSRTWPTSSRHPAGAGLDLDDDQRHRVHPLALYIAVGRRQGIAPDRLNGTVQNDILKEYIARGTYIFPPTPSMRLITDVFAWCRTHVPRWNTISISGYHIREAGSTAVQEVAFTLANGVAYVQAALDAGLDVDAFAPQLSFFFNAHNDLLEEIAKYRAARRLWARIMRDRFKARDPRSMMLRFHAQTAGSMLTAQQPENNIVRVTVQALAAVLGGCQSLHTNSMDEALSLPTERRCASRCAPSRSWPTSPGWPTRSIPWGLLRRRAPHPAARGGAEAYIAKIDGWAAPCRPSPTCNARSRTPPTAISRRWRPSAHRGGRQRLRRRRARGGKLFQVDPAVGAAAAERLETVRRTATPVGRAGARGHRPRRPRARQT